MLNREQRQELNIIFTARKKITDFFNWNVKEVDLLIEVSKSGLNKRDYSIVINEIRKGNEIKRDQKREMLMLSIQKIADLFNLPRHIISYNWKLFNECGYQL